MGKIIEIRFHFGEWTQTTRANAIRFARMLFYSFTVPMTDAEKIQIINSKHVRGEALSVSEVKACP